MQVFLVSYSPGEAIYSMGCYMESTPGNLEMQFFENDEEAAKCAARLGKNYEHYFIYNNDLDKEKYPDCFTFNDFSISCHTCTEIPNHLKNIYEKEIK